MPQVATIHDRDSIKFRICCCLPTWERHLPSIIRQAYPPISPRSIDDLRVGPMGEGLVGLLLLHSCAKPVFGQV